MNVLVVVTEVIGWAAGAFAGVFVLLGLVVRVADGAWRHQRVVLMVDEQPPMARWFGEGHRVGEAPLTPEVRAAAGESDEVDAWVREAEPARVRMRRVSEWVPRLLLLGGGCALLAVAASVTQLVAVAG